MARKKVSIIGAGFVGSTTALILSQKDICDIVLHDIVEGVAKGKALDMQQSAPILGFSTKIIGTSDYAATKNSDIVIISAGMPRKPGMTREELLEVNAKIIASVAKEIKKFSKSPVIIVVSNPVDAMAYAAKKAFGFGRSKVIGMSGALDSARFKTFLAQEAKVFPKDVNALVLGGHGDDMVPLSKSAEIDKKPLSNFISKEQIKNAEEKTRKAGAEIVGLLKTGSAYFAPSAAIAEMAESILLDQKKILPASVYLEGEYGFKGFFMGVPVVLGKDGAEKIIELKLGEEERKAFEKSALSIKELTLKAEMILEGLL